MTTTETDAPAEWDSFFDDDESEDSVEFIPASGDFVNSVLLGNASTTMIGQVVDSRFFKVSDYPTAAALSVVLPREAPVDPALVELHRAAREIERALGYRR